MLYAVTSTHALMSNSDHDLEQDLAALRPRAVSPVVIAALARELDGPAAHRGIIIAWSAGLSAVAALFIAALTFTAGPTPRGDFAVEVAAPSYRLVRADQSPAAVEYYRPVQMADGSFARPLHVRWANTTRWEDTQTNTRLINFQPQEQLAFVPLELN